MYFSRARYQKKLNQFSSSGEKTYRQELFSHLLYQQEISDWFITAHSFPFSATFKENLVKMYVNCVSTDFLFFFTHVVQVGPDIYPYKYFKANIFCLFIMKIGPETTELISMITTSCHTETWEVGNRLIFVQVKRRSVASQQYLPITKTT